MTNTLKSLCAISVAALSLAACTPEDQALNKAPGTYKSDVKSTDANGVTTEQKDVTDVSVDQYGHKKAVVKSKTTEKPPGVINGFLNKKTTNDSTTTVEEK